MSKKYQLDRERRIKKAHQQKRSKNGDEYLAPAP
jgi:hypothetical protein